MDLSPIQQHYVKENGAEDQLMHQSAMRTEWEPCLAHHPPLQGFAVGCEDVGVGAGQPPPPPPPSKRRFRSPHHGKGGLGGSNDGSMAMNPLDDRAHHGGSGKMRETLMERQVRNRLN